MTTTRFAPAQLRDAPSMAAVFQQTVAACPDAIALRTPDGPGITWREYGERVRRLAAGLHALGVRRGDTVALMMANRPEFHLLDAAAFHLGAIPFSVYNTSSAEQIAYLFGNAGNRIAVAETQFLDRVAGVDKVVCADQLGEIEAAGDPGFDFDAAWRAVGPDDVLTLIYTSGTTGPPKGVEITHRNIAFSMGAALDNPAVAAAADPGRMVSYLPDAHLANRYFAHYLPMATGGAVTCVADAKTLTSVLPRIRPTVFLGVPALWYKVKAGIDRAVAEQPAAKRMLANWALRIGRAAVRDSVAGRPLLRLRHAIARRLVLARLPARVGLDACLLPVSAAAPIAVETLEFLMAAGIPVCEGWAMSESSVHGTLNPSDAIRLGTVGTPMPGVELRLAADGELLLRSPAVMRGYRGEPAKTADAIDPDGWLRTGDIGTIDADGYVSIVDRKKELIINAAGKNMSPANIENAVRAAHPLVGAVAAIGDRRPFVVALVTLDPDAAAAFASEHALADDPAVLAKEPAVRAEIAAAIQQANAKLSRVEQIKEFSVLPVYWLPGGTELTPTMKLRRKPIAETYSAEIEALYAGYSPR